MDDRAQFLAGIRPEILMGAEGNSRARSRRSVLAAGLIALAAIAIAGMVAHPLLIGTPSLDASFPSEPSERELLALRKAYSEAPGRWPKPRLLPGARFTEMAPLEVRPAPEGKQLALARIGRELFEDPGLSASGQIACQSCHNRQLGWGDALPTSFGHGRAKGKRNAMPLFSVGYKSAFFWDGRSASLEEQALGPLTEASEMANHDLTAVVDRINANDSYREALIGVTGGDKVEAADIISALANFQRTLERPTRFDRYLRGDQNAFSDTEIWGLHIFRTKAGCANCHSGPLLSDGRFHNLGLSFFNRTLEDLGRFNVTGAAADTGKFLTPSLRHVSKTAPYMHNGIFPSLAGLIRFYEGGGGRVRSGQSVPAQRKALLDAVIEKSPQLKSFSLTPSERAALVAFLESL